MISGALAGMLFGLPAYYLIAFLGLGTVAAYVGLLVASFLGGFLTYQWRKDHLGW